ncbi:MAG: SpoIIE family protein phosphatase [Candidatus Shapirobacteria bacterium]|jgi:serine/threonine protein phosphatase PrpC
MKSNAAEHMNPPNVPSNRAKQMPPPPRSKLNIPKAEAANDGATDYLDEADVRLLDEDGDGQESGVTTIEQGPVSTRDNVYNIEKTKNEIEATEITGYTDARVYLGMKNKVTIDPDTKQRTINPSEDFVLSSPSYGLTGVEDGVGSSGEEGTEVNGLNAAAQASRILSATIADQFGEVLDSMGSSETMRALKGVKVLDIPSKINAPQNELHHKNTVDAIRTMEQVAASNPKLAKKAAALVKTLEIAQSEVRKTHGQTTACIAIQEGKQMAIANVGDSVAFIQRKDGTFVQITREDNLLNHCLDHNILTTEDLDQMRANPKEKRTIEIEFKGRTIKMPVNYKILTNHVLKGFGAEDEDATPTLTFVDVEPGDRVLLVTDGIGDKYRNPDGSIDTARLTRYIGRSNEASATEQIEHTINVAGIEQTAGKAGDDDKTIAVIDIK